MPFINVSNHGIEALPAYLVESNNEIGLIEIERLNNSLVLHLHTCLVGILRLLRRNVILHQEYGLRKLKICISCSLAHLMGISTGWLRQGKGKGCGFCYSR